MLTLHCSDINLQCGLTWNTIGPQYQWGNQCYPWIPKPTDNGRFNRWGLIGGFLRTREAVGKPSKCVGKIRSVFPTPLLRFLKPREAAHASETSTM